MVTQDPRLSAELRFEFRPFEPGAVLVEQLSALAIVPAMGAVASRRFSKRAAAGLFAGVLLASGTAYAARDHIPVLNSIVGESHHRAPVVPRPDPSPTLWQNDRAVQQGPAVPTRSTGTEGNQGQQDQDQQRGGSGTTQGQQSDSGSSSSGDSQQSSPTGTSNGQDQSTTSGTDTSSGSSGGGTSSSGDGTSGPSDGSSTGQ